MTAVAATSDNGSFESAFQNDDQSYATVACSGDGNFVVTWTNVRNGMQDIYARQFNSNGQALGAAFAVTIPADEAFTPTYANVAMNESGQFVVTWSSYGQEDGLGAQSADGWGVYARRYDASGDALSPEFQVNVTTAGDQENSSVAMADDGRFVIVWRSSQAGVPDNIIYRCFNPDGSPVTTSTSEGYLYGETLVNRPAFGERPTATSDILTWRCNRTETASSSPGRVPTWQHGVGHSQPQLYLAGRPTRNRANPGELHSAPSGRLQRSNWVLQHDRLWTKRCHC